jgi:hypothetical protein
MIGMDGNVADIVMSGLGSKKRPNEAFDFESALTSTPDISLHRAN